MGAQSVGDVAVLLNRWLHELMPNRDGRRDRLIATLIELCAGDDRAADESTIREVERVCHEVSKHLVLAFDGNQQHTADTVSRGWPPPDGDAVHRCAGGLGTVDRRGNTTVVVLSSLEDVGLARPYLDAAMMRAGGSPRLALDLRHNGGGDPGTVAYIAGWLLGGPGRELSTVIAPASETSWVTSEVSAGVLPFTGDVDVLIDHDTFSSAEALAYHLQVRHRARLIGERTRGGADHVTPIQLTAHVSSLVPCAVVVDAHSGSNWEGSGLCPDVECAGGEALEVALRSG